MTFAELKNNKLLIVSNIVLAGFILSAFYHYFMGVYLNLPYHFLYNPAVKFSDFYVEFDLVPNLNPYYESNGFWANYFPLTYLIFYFFHFLKSKTLALIFFEMIWIIFFIWYAVKEILYKAKFIDVKAIIIISLLTYPFLFCIDRANVEGYLFVFTALFFYYYKKQSIITSSFFLAAAISMKLFPAVFIILLLSDKKYKGIIITSLFSFLMFLIPLSLFRGGMLNNFIGMLHGMNWFMQFFDSTLLGLCYNNSLYGVVKSSLLLLNFSAQPVLVLKNFYPVFSILVFIIASFYIIISRPNFWKRSTVLVFSMILLPYVSFDYKLIFLAIPIFLFINSEEDIPSDFTKLYAVIFALLVINKNYFFLKIGCIPVSISSFINPVLMAIMMSFFIYESYMESKVKKEILN